MQNGLLRLAFDFSARSLGRFASFMTQTSLLTRLIQLSC
jgi:hypothetical protein